MAEARLHILTPSRAAAATVGAWSGCLIDQVSQVRLAEGMIRS
jgi:hypothetical protein